MANVFQTTSKLKTADYIDHILARVGFRRSSHRVDPGLYQLNSPNECSDVFVTANYTLSFNAVRAALKERDAFLLVMDTKGVNVWCAAGKGTFGTDELISKVISTGLAEHVKHRNLILPQLGATGVSAHVVKQTTGFDVEYGPVRAEDLPEYLIDHIATPDMRKVRFNLTDRLVLTPVEIVNSFLPVAAICLALYLAGGIFSLSWGLAGWFTACVLFMALLPWLPTRKFSIKGWALGFIISLPFILFQFLQPGVSIFSRVARVLPELLIIPALVAYYSLNMTGSTLITNWTNVKREIARYIPVMAIVCSTGIILLILRIIFIK